MAQVINTNVASLNAQRQLYKSQSAQQTAMERLSSGLRINSAKDDAAGLAIADRMTSQVKGLAQAMRNANDGISVSQTAEGAMGEITNSLQRMRELAVQAANDTNTASDRVSIQKEVAQLQQEITRVATQTQFNGKNLIDGTFTNQSFQIGAYANQTMSFSIGNVQAANIGNYSRSTDGTMSAAVQGAVAGTAPANNFAGQTLTVSGSVGSASTAALGAGSSAYSIATAVNNLTQQTGVTATATTTATLSSLGGAGSVTFNLTGSGTAAIAANVANVSDLQSLADAINGKTATTGITAAATGGSLTLTSSDGHDIKIDTFNNTNATKTVNLTGGSGAAVVLTGGAATDSGTVGGTVSFSDSSNFSVLTNTAGNTFINGAAANTGYGGTLNAVGSVNVGTQSGAQSAIQAIDGALQYIDNSRATLGAVQNRFSSAISNMQTTSDNVSAARSRIQDTDFAATTSELSRTQILQQAGTAMLAQANASTQNVLTLLRG